MSAHNLVPVYFDKSTGRYHLASKAEVSGSYGYLHEQLGATTTWLIPHNGDTRNFICQVYDTNGNLLIPDEQLIIDNNNIEITFTTAQDGYAHIMFFQTA